MNPKNFFVQFCIAFLIFLAVDSVWLGLIAPPFYKRHIGHLLSPNINWAAAGAFYLIFIGGLVAFVIRPAFEVRSVFRALWLGALFGLVTYATYDLTNMATLRDWPWIVVIVDLLWGIFLSATVGSVSVYWLCRLKT